MATVGSCPMCQRKGVKLTEHHVVEAPDENGKAPSIDLCEECHKMHEKYRNYLRDECHIDIDHTKK
jgi:hypothetical protein